jgi:Na+-driven multidrug efflux pump
MLLLTGLAGSQSITAATLVLPAQRVKIAACQVLHLFPDHDQLDQSVGLGLVCLTPGSESWATEMLVLLSGLLPNPQLSISTMAITANMHDICYLMTAGMGSATSTRVAQSLGGGRPSTARLTVMVSEVTHSKGQPG